MLSNFRSLEILFLSLIFKASYKTLKYSKGELSKSFKPLFFLCLYHYTKTIKFRDRLCLMFPSFFPVLYFLLFGFVYIVW